MDVIQEVVGSNLKPVIRSKNFIFYSKLPPFYLILVVSLPTMSSFSLSYSNFFWEGRVLNLKFLISFLFPFFSRFSLSFRSLHLIKFTAKKRQTLGRYDGWLVSWLIGLMNINLLLLLKIYYRAVSHLENWAKSARSHSCREERRQNLVLERNPHPWDRERSALIAIMWNKDGEGSIFNKTSII